jgi:biotin--protein ligase
MPGGADRPYLERLGGKGNANIREFVNNGGNFLGICAGAYYSADRIEFAKGDVDLEVTGKRELKFFPGLVEGPTYSGFDHRNTDNVSGMRAATIHWTHDTTFANDKDFVLFYNGGGHFVDAEQFSNVTILARYAAELPNRPNSPAAIVECKVGTGKAVLSGPHFEWFAESLEDSEHEMVLIKQKLSDDNANRMELAKHLLARLNIATK